MGLDRKLGKILERYPLLHQIGKNAYLRFCYLFCSMGKKEKPIEVYHSFDGFFGYYDKSPWDKNDTHYLFHSFLDSKTLGIQVANLHTNEIRQVAATKAWSLQQGAMLQWLPGEDAVIFNTVVDRNLSSKILWLDNKKEHLCSFPIQTVHPDGGRALTLNYRRLHKIRPEYGYNVEVENFSPDQPDDEDGIWRINLKKNTAELIISIKQLAEYSPRPEMKDSMHKVNHIMYSPSGENFVFLHRWIGKRGKYSRLFVASSEGGKTKQMRLLMDEKMVSHYSWRDDENLLVYGRIKDHGDRYYLLNVYTGKHRIIGKDVLDRFGDGHPSYSPDKRWIITDTYPDKARMQHLLLWDVENQRLYQIGRFFAPWKYDGPNRMDLHPRWSNYGKLISIDSAHEGRRKTYILSGHERH